MFSNTPASKNGLIIPFNQKLPLIPFIIIIFFDNTKYEEFFNLSEAKKKFIEIFNTLYRTNFDINFDLNPSITMELLQTKELQIFNALPKGITRNIINTVPFAQAERKAREYKIRKSNSGGKNRRSKKNKKKTNKRKQKKNKKTKRKRKQ